MNRKSFGLLAVSTTLLQFNCLAGNCEEQEASSSIVVNAPPKAVWQALRADRFNNQKRKVIAHNGCDYTFTEVFKKLPLIGETTCTWVEHETPETSIQYHMISSDKLKAFQGCWRLAPASNGQQTILTLSSLTDCGLEIPFHQKMTHCTTLSYINRRLESVKSRVDENRVDVAEQL
ncbi:MAG TPA: hypothetical protein V6C97_20580 [Oculatellaceae cyanobacterium]